MKDGGDGTRDRRVATLLAIRSIGRAKRRILDILAAGASSGALKGQCST
jgi:hypothetical protein